MGKCYFVMPLAPPAKRKPKTKAERVRERLLAGRRKRLSAPLEFGCEVGGQRPGTWPQRSMALGVHPKQVAEGNALQAKHKTGCYHDRTGKLVCPDAASKKRAMKLKTSTFGGKTVGLVDYESFS